MTDSRPEMLFRTQHPELLQPDDTVLFRRGSVFRGPLQNPSGRSEHPIHYGAYGEGESPVLRLPKPFRPGTTDVGQASGGLRMLSGETANRTHGDGTCGALRWTREELCEQGDWFDSCLGYSIQHLPLAAGSDAAGYFAGKSRGLLRKHRMRDLGYRWLAHCGHDMVISDLEFLQWGVPGSQAKRAAGICASKTAGLPKIGGAVWEKTKKIRFGNAFECWNVAENVEVEHCMFDAVPRIPPSRIRAVRTASPRTIS